jgi:hypothetical protein
VVNFVTLADRVLSTTMMILSWKISGPVFLGLALALSGHAQIASGAGDIAAGPVKGAGSVAKGTAKGAGDVVTLHPIKGAESVTKGAAGAGKDVTVGAAKGTGKVVKGVGKVFKKVF